MHTRARIFARSQTIVNVNWNILMCTYTLACAREHTSTSVWIELKLVCTRKNNGVGDDDNDDGNGDGDSDGGDTLWAHTRRGRERAR